MVGEETEQAELAELAEQAKLACNSTEVGADKQHLGRQKLASRGLGLNQFSGWPEGTGVL